MPAQAQNEPVRFYNRAALPATALHVMRAGQASRSANLLNRGPLAPGQFHSVRLGEGAGCRFDVRLMLQDGTEIRRAGCRCLRDPLDRPRARGQRGRTRNTGAAADGPRQPSAEPAPGSRTCARPGTAERAAGPSRAPDLRTCGATDARD